MEQIFMKSISKKWINDKKVISNSHHGFNRGKSCLNNLIAFHDEMTSWVNEERADIVIYFDTTKVSDSFYAILMWKLRLHRLEEDG